MDELIEEWKNIPDFPKYEVSNFGQVRSVQRTWSGLPQLRSPVHSRDGYLRVALYKDHKRYAFSIHRLVLTAFIGPPTAENNICHHKDRNRTNNRLDNLEWSNQSLNIIASNTASSREYRAKKLNEEKVKKIRKLADSGIIQITIAEMFDVDPGMINKIILRKSWRSI